MKRSITISLFVFILVWPSLSVAQEITAGAGISMAPGIGYDSGFVMKAQASWNPRGFLIRQEGVLDLSNKHLMGSGQSSIYRGTFGFTPRGSGPVGGVEFVSFTGPWTKKALSAFGGYRFSSEGVYELIVDVRHDIAETYDNRRTIVEGLATFNMSKRMLLEVKIAGVRFYTPGASEEDLWRLALSYRVYLVYKFK